MVQRKHLVLIVLLHAATSCIYPKTGAMKLESEILKIIDGKSFGITGYEIKLMLQVLLKLKSMLASTQGSYTFEGHRYNIHQLASLETDIEHAWYEQKKHAPEKTSTLEQEERRFHARKHALNQVLEEAKHDFEEKIMQFMDHARGAKSQLMMLIKESCILHGRPNSLLLTWGEAPEGQEKETLHKNSSSFKLLELLCEDLMNFLIDMIHSCPKAVAHYEELKAQWNEQHKN